MSLSNFFKSALTSVLWSFASFSVADSSPPLSFLDAYKFAQTAAPDLAVARYKVESRDADRAIALAKILPQANLFGQFSDNRIRYDAELSVADQNFYGQRYGLLVRQSLLNVAEGLEASRLKSVLEQSQEELAVAETELLSSLMEAYLTALLADADLEQYEAELKSLESQLREANALYERSLLPVTQVLETQTRADTLRADVIMARGNSLIAREEVSQLTGQEVDELVEVKETFTLISRFKSAYQAAQAASLNSPAVAAAEAAVDAARKGVDGAKANWLPTVDLTYSFQHSDVGFDNMQSPARDTSTVAVGFEYPLFSGGARIARVRGAKAKFNSADTMFRAEVTRAEARARSAWLSLQAVEERLVAAKKSVVSSRTNLDASRKAVSAGTARVSDVLIALSQNTTALRDYSQAKFQYAMAWVELEMATGSDPSHIASVVSRAIHGE